MSTMKTLALTIVEDLKRVVDATKDDHLSDRFGDTLAGWLSLWRHGASGASTVKDPVKASPQSSGNFITAKEVREDLLCHQASFSKFKKAGWLVPVPGAKPNKMMYIRSIYDQHREKMVTSLEDREAMKNFKAITTGQGGTPLATCTSDDT